MKIKFSREDNFGEKCNMLEMGSLHIHFDVNPHWPFGFCAGISVGTRWVKDLGNEQVRFPALGISMCLNAYHGDPNRIYINAPKNHYMIGLIEWHTFKETGRKVVPAPNRWNENRTITQIEGHDVRCWPRLERGQAWDFEKSQGTQPIVWRWIVKTPHDSRERWARAHPEEAAEAAARHAEYEAMRSERKLPDAPGTSESPPQEVQPSEE